MTKKLVIRVNWNNLVIPYIIYVYYWWLVNVKKNIIISLYIILILKCNLVVDCKICQVFWWVAWQNYKIVYDLFLVLTTVAIL